MTSWHTENVEVSRCKLTEQLSRCGSVEAVAGCPVTKCDRPLVNEEAVAACLRDGEGLFIAAIQRRLRRKHLAVRWYEHDLLSEISGKPIQLRGMKDTQPGHHLSRGGRIEPRESHDRADPGTIRRELG